MIKLSGIVPFLMAALVSTASCQPAVASPVGIQSDGSGGLQLSYLGVLQESTDLVNWTDITPQPPSPWSVSTTGDAWFVRSKAVAGNGLLEMPEIFTDFMVLQRDQPVPIWGYLPPTAEVEVSFGGNTYRATADASGRWEVILPAMGTNWGGRTMTIRTGWETREIDEVVVGDVWFVSGGSCMNLTLEELGTAEADAELTDTFDDMLRVFVLDEAAARNPRTVATGDWHPSVPGALEPVAAVPYYFGKKLRSEVGIPIGIIECARDSQPIESYLSDTALGTFSQGQAELYAKSQAYANWASGATQSEYQSELAAWEANPVGPRPTAPVDPALRPEIAGQTFNAMINPVADYEVRGLLWYQGEIDATWSKSIFYREFLENLASDLRGRFGAQKPFYYVQLANFEQPGETGGGLTWVTTQDEMRRALPTISLAGNAGMVVANDIGDPSDINPSNQKEIGERLARWALRNEYEKSATKRSGPVFKSSVISGSTVELSFDHSAGLASSNGQPLSGFQVRAAGQAWVNADAVISGNKVVVSASQVNAPVAARYAWDDNPTFANLTNASGLPAGLFATSQGLEMPAMFSDGMILQREKGAKIWGWVCGGCSVSVQFDGRQWETTADDLGRWEVVLDNLAASSVGRDLVITTDEEVRTISDVLVGEVWLGGGQSNMEFRFSYLPTPANNAEAASANDPLLRVFVANEQARKDPQRIVQGDWLRAQSGDMPDMPLTPYHYAKVLRAQLGVPVGVIENAWGGQPIQGYIEEEKLLTFPEGVSILNEKTAAYAAWDQALADYEAELAAWNANPQGPAPEPPTGDPQFEANLGGQSFNGMVAPIAGYGVRGIIFYHGEANSFGFSSNDYRELFVALVENWREKWGEDLPFYYMQLPNFDHEGARPGWVRVQDEQRLALANLTNVGMAIGNDIGDPNDVHPADKTQIGDRLSRWSLVNQYGQSKVLTGPIYQSHSVKGATIEVQFQYGEGLKTSDGLAVQSLEIREAGGAWTAATGTIVGDKLVISAPGINSPVSARYAWDSNPTTANLRNGADLPASLFITD
ncbi:sialate O-acetylesterase [Roseibacillus persicicus]|uniref:sialate O-acetylesterase n=1 Tax=Roseibacillus persicicus TaxID=454148 RepID=UPI00398B2783